jgi:hypothetical protein
MMAWAKRETISGVRQAERSPGRKIRLKYDKEWREIVKARGIKGMASEEASGW